MAALAAEEAATLGAGMAKTEPSFFSRFMNNNNNIPQQYSNSNNPFFRSQQQPYYPYPQQQQQPYYPYPPQQQPQGGPSDSGGIVDSLSTYGAIIQLIHPGALFIFLLPLTVIMYFLIPKVYDNSKETTGTRIGYAILFALPIYIPIVFFIARAFNKVVFTLLPFAL